MTKKKPYLVCGGPGLTAASKAGPPGVATARSKAAEVQQAAIRDLAVGDVEEGQQGAVRGHGRHQLVGGEPLQGELLQPGGRGEAGDNQRVAQRLLLPRLCEHAGTFREIF